MFPLPPTPTAPHEIWSVDSQEIFEIVTTRCQILRLKCTKFDFGWGSAPDPAGGAYSAPPDPQLDLRGPTSKGGEGRGGQGRGRGERREGRLKTGPPWSPKPSYAAGQSAAVIPTEH